MINNNATITISLVDMAGRTVLTGKQLVYSGVNNLNLAEVQAMQAGVYILQVINKDSVIRKQVIKK